MERLWVRAVIALFALLWVTAAVSQTRVRGYFRKNGTYVAPHYRSSPNSSRLDNWSTRGNVNPYTGQPGTHNPYPTTTYTSPVYHPRTYTLPAYQPRRSYPQTYSYPATTYRSYSAPTYQPPASASYSAQPRVESYTYTAPIWGSAPKPIKQAKPEVSWYRCDEEDGSYHYSHRPGPGCSFSGTSQ